MEPKQLEPDIPCLICTPDPPYVTGRLKLAMNLVYRSGMYGSQFTWPTLWVASLEYNLNKSTSQAGELPQVCQNDWNNGNHNSQDLAGGISLVVGRNKEKYLVPMDMDLSAGHNK